MTAGHIMCLRHFFTKMTYPPCVGHPFVWWVSLSCHVASNTWWVRHIRCCKCQKWSNAWQTNTPCKFLSKHVKHQHTHHVNLEISNTRFTLSVACLTCNPLQIHEQFNQSTFISSKLGFLPGYSSKWLSNLYVYPVSRSAHPPFTKRQMCRLNVGPLITVTHTPPTSKYSSDIKYLSLLWPKHISVLWKLESISAAAMSQKQCLTGT